VRFEVYPHLFHCPQSNYRTVCTAVAKYNFVSHSVVAYAARTASF
jgi:hypothetical protein